MKPIHVVLSLFLAMAAVNAPAATCPVPSRGISPVICDDYITAPVLYSSMISQLVSLYSNKQTVVMQNLLGQLERRHHAVSLQRTPFRRLSLPDLYEQRRESVGVVCGLYKCSHCSHWHGSTASGFFIAESGEFLTNYHVINGKGNVAMGVMTFDGRMHPILEVLAADKVNDVALVKVQGREFKPLSISRSNRVGSSIAVISHPLQNFFTLSSGIISVYITVPNNTNVLRRMTITADYAVGSSGAPVLNEKGAVTGMIVDTETICAEGGAKGPSSVQMVVKHCVPAELILKLLE